MACLLRGGGPHSILSERMLDNLSRRPDLGVAGIRGSSLRSSFSTAAVEADGTLSPGACFLTEGAIASQVITLSETRVGKGDRAVVLWCEGRPVIVRGLEEYPAVGDQYEAKNELWRVVEISDRYLYEPEERKTTGFLPIQTAAQQVRFRTEIRNGARTS